MALVEARFFARFVVLAIAATGILLAVLACSSREAGVSPNVPDVPVYPDAELVSRIDQADRDPTDTYNVLAASEAGVLDWYRDRMAAAGWAAISNPADNVILYNDVDGCYAFVTATQDGEDVFLQISQQRPGSQCIKTLPVDPGDQ